MRRDIIQRQFNKQADQFSSFKLTTSRVIFEFIFDFCEMKPHDTLLDVACGSGDFAIYCANKITYACGCDISDGLLKLARNAAGGNALVNADFLRCDVSTLPFDEQSFSIASCRSAFHHMDDYPSVFKDMLRCLQPGGKVVIQDMTAYADEGVNRFFEEMETCIDLSHYRALSGEDITALFADNRIGIVNSIEAELSHHLKEYVGHAVQSKEDSERLDDLVSQALVDPVLSKYFFHKGNELYFKKSGMVIFGVKE